VPRTNDTALDIEAIFSEPESYIKRFFFRDGGHTTVARLFGRIPDYTIARKILLFSS
jgi:hypothetical protein